MQFYTLDAADRLIVCGHEFSMHPLDAEVGATLDYAPLPKSRIIILDSRGKEHLLAIEQETLKAP